MEETGHCKEGEKIFQAEEMLNKEVIKNLVLQALDDQNIGLGPEKRPM